MGKRLEQTSIQRRYTNGQQVHKRCSILLIIREKHIKIAMKYYYNNNSENNKFCLGWGETEFSTLLVEI